MKHAQGPLLSIDVGERTAETEDVDDVLREFPGGRGLNTRLAYERVPFDVDPLGPANRVYFATGPMQYSTTSYTGRMAATGVSPLTDGLLSSNAGGFLSRNFTGAGYAAVEITGASDELVAVHVRERGSDGDGDGDGDSSVDGDAPRVTFEPVPELAEAEVSEVSGYMAAEHDLSQEHVACIGPAGENQVRFASIMTSDTRAFGRGGLGAVLGAKNVKAVTFDGDADEAVNLDWPDAAGDVHREAATQDHIMKRQGTTSVAELANAVDALPSYYFAEQSYEDIESISGDRVEEKKYKKGTCSQCAFACKLPTKDEARAIETEGPEYETLMAFGSNAGVDDIVDVMAANELCDELGLDTISCGDAVSMYLSAEDEFGNADLITDLVERIAYREGVGDQLAEGVARAHEQFDRKNWTVKGMEFSAHDGRKLNGQGLGFATSNRGADHMYGEFYPYEYPLVDEEQALDPSGLEGKPPKLAAKENRNAVLDSAVVCKFSRGTITDERLATLLDDDYEELLEMGGRVVELERAFNNARGFDREDDVLPYDIEGLDGALDEYYAYRGWNADGTVPGYDAGDVPALSGDGGAASADD